MVIRKQSFTTHCIFITLNDFKWFISKIQFLEKINKKKNLHFYFKCSKFSGGRVFQAAAAHVLRFNSTKWHWLELQMSNILSPAYFLLNHPCMRHPGRSYSTSYGNLQEPNACTVHYTITNFFWTRVSPVDGRQRDAAGFNLCTAMLNSFGTDGTPYLCKHALVVIACVRTLPRDVSAGQFWWIISSCTRLTTGRTHVKGPSSGLGSIFVIKRPEGHLLPQPPDHLL